VRLEPRLLSEAEPEREQPLGEVGRGRSVVDPPRRVVVIAAGDEPADLLVGLLDLVRREAQPLDERQSREGAQV
jgi:hypothetical protein